MMSVAGRCEFAISLERIANDWRFDDTGLENKMDEHLVNDTRGKRTLRNVLRKTGEFGWLDR